MKIAYLNFILARNLIGVEKKISQQAKLSPAGFDFFILNRFVDRKQGNVNLIKIKSGDYYSYLFRKFELIEQTINLLGYDFVVLRYPLADKTCLKFVEKYNVISEHHSDEIPELKSNIIGHTPIHLKVASLVRLLLERQYGKRYRERCKGILAVTDELRHKEVNKIKVDMPSMTISNGIDVESIRKTGFKKPDESGLNLIFIASRLSPWDGLERIIESINNYKGKYRIKLHIVGDIKPSDIKMKPVEKVIFHGIKEGGQLDQIFSEMNLAISTMGLYSKNLREAASLKTREYTARGIPFILAYEDVDLRDVNEHKKFFLQLPNKDETIQLDMVVKFVEDINKRFNTPSDLSGYMHRYAFEKMGWKTKMQKYLEICEQIAITRT